MKEDLSRIRELFDMQESQLYQSLVDYQEDYHGVLFSPSDKAQVGREILARIRPALFQRICIEWAYCEKRQRPEFQDPVTLAATVADLIASACGAIPPFNVAVLLVKLGLSGLCKCEDNHDTE